MGLKVLILQSMKTFATLKLTKFNRLKSAKNIKSFNPPVDPDSTGQALI
jgi:hypothetical protein